MGRFFQYNRLGNSNALAPKDNQTQIQVASSMATTARSMTCKKYQNWSRRVLKTGSGSAATSTASSCTDSSSDMDEPSFVDSVDRDHLVAINSSGSTARRPRVYDCMKDFLRRKLFHHMLATSVAQAQAPTKKCNAIRNEPMLKHFTRDNVDDNDVTSDYDEIDMLDSSYNADEEDTTDCCSDYSCHHIDDDDDEVLIPSPQQSSASMKPKMSSPLRSALSLNCCQKSQTDSEEPEPADGDADDVDSDAGFSDGCQLIGETLKRSKRRGHLTKASRQRHQNANRKNRAHTTDEECPELLENSWFQPRITTKHALARLQLAEPGSFLVRRKSRTYELCLRVESKVKLFTVLSTANMHYKLKGAKKQFSTLKALVTHHSVMAEQLPVTLILPRAEKQLSYTSERCADDFDTFESLQILGILKSLQAKNVEFP